MSEATDCGGIYAIREKGRGRYYIGSSRSISARWSAHRYYLRKGKHHSPHLQRAWNLYGEDAFEFLVLEKVDDPSQLTAREQHWIDVHKAADDQIGFNVGPVAGSRAGVPHSEEVRKRMSNALKGRRKSTDHRAKIGSANRGKRRSQKERDRISAMARERHSSSDAPGKATRFVKGQKAPNARKVMSEDQKAKLREKAKARMSDPAYKERWLEVRRAKIERTRTCPCSS